MAVVVCVLLPESKPPAEELKLGSLPAIYSFRGRVFGEDRFETLDLGFVSLAVFYEHSGKSFGKVKSQHLS